ncbi:MAG: 23S rRNA (pseudouridine(1915)-N(3))-methyltransferase RlmH [Muribaculaceae bacterium]|nr:23S rRNA (pseudouridine(1915)-N(3))-methyltransferase RlmH [Muribaculaceae bacterium]
MKILLISVGIMREAPLKELFERYSSKIPFYMPFEAIAIPDIKGGKGMTPDNQKIKEGEAILGKISNGDYVVLMDERGGECTSRQFAEFIDKKASVLARNLVFVIGGPYGFSRAVYDRADRLAGLSKMTFTHEMARVLTAEQIYRAMTILRGEPYHHD